jgi:peptide/nickel transport system permease protein
MTEERDEEMTKAAHIIDPAVQGSKRKTYYSDILGRFRKHKLAMFGLIIMTFIVAAVILLPLLLGLDPYSTSLRMPYTRPSKEFILGFDGIGRDNFARLVYGGRVSLTVGLLSTLVSILIGVPLGLCAGYFRGWFEVIVMRLVDIFMSFPSMILILVLVSIIGPSMWSVTLVIGVMGWPQFARFIYGNVLSVRSKEYVEGAYAIGAKDYRILRDYILPNSIAPIFITATFRTAGAILEEAALSFLGMGVQPPQASWGNILYGAQSITVLATRTWFWLPPGIMLALTVLSINFIGDGLRDALDPKIKT